MTTWSPDSYHTPYADHAHRAWLGKLIHMPGQPLLLHKPRCPQFSTLLAMDSFLHAKSRIHATFLFSSTSSNLVTTFFIFSINSSLSLSVSHSLCPSSNSSAHIVVTVLSHVLHLCIWHVFQAIQSHTTPSKICNTSLQILPPLHFSDSVSIATLFTQPFFSHHLVPKFYTSLLSFLLQRVQPHLKLLRCLWM